MPSKSAINKHIEKYLSLRNEIDKECLLLWRKHHKNMQCKLGCSSCCQAFKILPLEYESIKVHIQNNSVKINTKAEKGDCNFLVENTCSIYENRPVICRSHGYPMVRLNEEYDAYDMTYCHLNFKNYPIEKFNADNVYYEDDVNSKLFKLNQQFLKEIPEMEFDPIQLIELNDIVEEL